MNYLRVSERAFLFSAAPKGGPTGFSAVYDIGNSFTSEIGTPADNSLITSPILLRVLHASLFGLDLVFNLWSRSHTSAIV